MCSVGLPHYFTNVCIKDKFGVYMNTHVFGMVNFLYDVIMDSIRTNDRPFFLGYGNGLTYLDG